ncbi:MAG: S8 family serine peptidase, partial [Atopobiaceae bacterium]|nr:S8 family serine peptidase [Atopobiaceae bacterium]
MKQHRIPSCWLFTSFVVALMYLALLPLVAHADEIDDMLAAGSYAEGEIIAAFFPQSGELMAQSEAPYEVTPLMRVGTSAIVTDDDALTAQSEESLTLSSVSSATLSTEELLRLLAEDPNVAFAEPNYTFSLEDANQSGTKPRSVLSPQVDASTVGDLKSMQWGNWTTDQTMRTEAFTANPSVNVPNFAASLRGANMSKPIVVALLDTAVDNRHPDLINVLYHFSPEQQAALGCYDMGYNAGNKGARGNYYNPESVSIGHGTHTAGIIGAEWNSFGTSGVASDVRIVSIDFASKGGTVTTSDAICAFEFVDRFNKQASDDERIRITSNSWGSMHTSRAIDAAVRKLGETWNTVSVFSAGNDGRNNDHYERANSYVQNNPYAVIVASSSGDEALNDSSEYGTGSVDLAAPGTRILSTMTDTDAHAQYLADATRSIDPLYVGFDGDSEPRVTVSQLYQDDKPSVWHDDTVVKPDVGTQVDNVHACGPGS